MSHQVTKTSETGGGQPGAPTPGRRWWRRAARRSRRVALIAVAAAALLTGAACSSSGSSSSAQPGPVTLTLWTKGPFPYGSTLVSMWNKLHPDIHVKLEVAVTSGTTIPQAQLLLDVKAHQTPDVAMFDYEYLPQFVSTGTVLDLNTVSGGNASSLASSYEPWAWSTVHVGNGLYGLPIDAGPLSLYYRKDLFAKYHLPVPATMAEYAQEAVTLHKDDPSAYMASFPANDASVFTAYAWAAGAQPFAVKGNSWAVNIADPASVKAANLFQQLISGKDILTLPDFSTEWEEDFSTGKIASWIAPAWAPGSLESFAPKTAGDWAVATMPEWTPGTQASGDWGGSNAVVFKATKYPRQALELAEFLTTNQQLWSQFWVAKASNYPANVAALGNPSFSQPVSFFGGQKIYQTIATSNSTVAHDFSFGPVANEWYTTEQNYLQQAANGQITLVQALQKTQASVVSYMRAQGFSVETP